MTNENIIPKEDIKRIIIKNINNKKKELAITLLEDIISEKMLRVIYDALFNIELINDDNQLIHYLIKRMFANPEADQILIEILIYLSEKPKLIYNAYTTGLIMVESEAENGVVYSQNYLKELDKEKLKELDKISIKQHKINELLKKHDINLELAEEAAESKLYKLSIEFMNDYNVKKRHTIMLVLTNDLYTGTFYGYPCYAHLSKNNTLEVNIAIKDDIVKLICDLKTNKVEEYINDMKTKETAECWLVKVSNEENKINQINNNNKAIENSNPYTLLKTL